MDGVVDPLPPGRWPLAPDPEPGMPPESPAAMPVQSLTTFDPATRRPLRVAGELRWRRILVFGGATLLTGVATWGMEQALSVGGMTPLEAVVLLLFAVNLAWIALTFVSSVAGAATIITRRAQARATRHWPASVGKTAVLMPAYNEDPERVFAALEAMATGVAAIAPGLTFDWFVLSDTTDPRAAIAEESAFIALRARIGQRARLYYRRRSRNVARKAGNIADFCKRWGGAYDYLLMLDADSLMDPETIVELTRRMAFDPDAGLIQTVPRLIRGTTLMARVHQFAGRVYGPVISSGLAWWTGSEGNYWGHNAIVRREAFVGSAGLPTLDGPRPFGGHILSHDFVEAALIRRAGWKVVIADDLAGSYEETPPSLIDFAIRDRRWCQGNLQHTRIVTARGLHWVSRFHLVSGIFSYMSSLLWVMLIFAGLAMAVQAKFTPTDYFDDPFQIFPTWPKLDSALEVRLLAFTVLVLLAPRILGLVVLLTDRDGRRDSGGAANLIVGSLFETLVSTLVAPIVMVMQSAAIVSIVRGRDGGWSPQRRDDGRYPISLLWRRHRAHVISGALLAWAAWYVSIDILLFLCPVVFGLLVSVPISLATGSRKVGRSVRRTGLLRTPEEGSRPVVERAAVRARAAHRFAMAEGQDIRTFLADHSRRRHHLAIVDSRGHRRPGEVDPMEAVVAVKVNEATTLDEALAFLRPEEQAVALGTRALFEKLSSLSAGRAVA